jgi:spore germination protein GerM
MTGARRRGRPWVRAMLTGVSVAVAGALTVAGCGIATEETPREIPTDAIPESLRGVTTPTTSVASEPGSARIETVYLVRSGRAGGADALEPVAVEVAESGSPEDLPRRVIDALVAARPDALDRPDLLNAVPPDTQVRRAELGPDGVLDLDLTDLDTVEGTLQRLAVAQLVFTLTQLVEPRVDAVRFSVDGQPVAVPVERGTVPAGEPVTRADDLTLLQALQAQTPTR